MVEIAATAVLAHCRVLYFSRDCVIYTVKEYPYWKIQLWCYYSTLLIDPRRRRLPLLQEPAPVYRIGGLY